MESTSLYYCDTTNERVKIILVFTCGLVLVKNKAKHQYQVLIRELKKVY
jgi:hypothetical protein